ncbi:MAG: TonB-dependent receptor, partial [bacterium]|nr:TonB-dependent receptor [bacterium]
SSEKILFMLNGHVIMEPYSGSAFNAHLSNLPVGNIARIEIVRGPGSTQYGANAFLGVVNIITKKPEEINGTELAVSTEFEERNNVGQRCNVLYGQRFKNEWGLALNLNIFDLDGPELFVEKDAFGRSGNADTEHEQVDLQASLDLGALTIDGRYTDIEMAGFYGVSNVLGRNTEHDQKFGFLEARLELDFHKDLETRITVYVDHLIGEPSFEIFPAGSIPPGHALSAWNDTGYIGGPTTKTTTIGGDLQTEFRGFERHTLVGGLVGRNERQDVKSFNNFNPGFLPTVQDVSDEYNFCKNASRDVFAVFFYDLWDITEKMRLAFGGRYDDYSDFGDKFSPRVGLAWGITEKLDLRLNYATAFRAPAFRDLYLQNNPIVVGNPDLDEEKIKTFEAGVGVRLTDRLFANVTYFHNDIEDLISLLPGEGEYKNYQSVRVDGLESEVRYAFESGVSLALNYTYTDSRIEHGSQHPNIVKHAGGAVANIPFSKYFNWNINVFYQGKTARDAADSRDDMNDYAVVNTSLSAKEFFKGLELQLSVFNLFDKDYTWPAPPNTIPGDYTAPGRSFFLSARYKF